MSGFISIKTPEGVEITHIESAGGNDYASVCGLALDGDRDSGVAMSLPKKPKIDCSSCYQIFEAVRGIKASDFAKEKK